MTGTLGNIIELKLTSVDADTNLAYNPATVALKIKTPGLVETTYTYAGGDITRVSTGVHKLQYKPAAKGHYYYRWETTTPDKVLEGEFDVETVYP